MAIPLSPDIQLSLLEFCTVSPDFRDLLRLSSVNQSFRATFLAHERLLLLSTLEHQTGPNFLLPALLLAALNDETSPLVDENYLHLHSRTTKRLGMQAPLSQLRQAIVNHRKILAMARIQIFPLFEAERYYEFEPIWNMLTHPYHKTIEEAAAPIYVFAFRSSIGGYPQEFQIYNYLPEGQTVFSKPKRFGSRDGVYELHGRCQAIFHWNEDLCMVEYSADIEEMWNEIRDEYPDVDDKDDIRLDYGKCWILRERIHQVIDKCLLHQRHSWKRYSEVMDLVYQDKNNPVSSTSEEKETGCPVPFCKVRLVTKPEIEWKIKWIRESAVEIKWELRQFYLNVFFDHGNNGFRRTRRYNPYVIDYIALNQVALELELLQEQEGSL